MQTDRKWCWQDWLIFILACSIALLLTSKGWDRVFIDGQVHPVGYDSFYHLVRIMAVVANPASVHAFEPNIHWPDGMWLPWPWAYDWVLGASAGLLTSSNEQARAAVMFAPLVLLLCNLTLFFLIARTLLRPVLARVALLAFAAAPLTMSLHMLGNIDHHVAEHSFLLLVLYLALRLARQPGSKGNALVLGAALGAATAFHNGLFILQIPLLLALALLRLRGTPAVGPATILATCLALLASQLLVLLPSHHFWTLEYSFYYLSWFHLHLALLTSLGLVALSLRQTRHCLLLFGLALLLTIPALPQALTGLGFVGSQYAALEGIQEANSPFWGKLQIRQVLSFYSLVLWFALPLLLWALWRLGKSRPKVIETVFLVFAVFGFLLLALQVRFYYFGAAQILLALFLAAQLHLGKPRDLLYASILIFGAYAQSITPYRMSSLPGDSDRYTRGQSLIETLEAACAEAPGLLIADRNWGNYLRYRTQCPIIANNFIMTEEDFAAIDQLDRFLEMEPEALARALPEMRYVLVSNSETSTLAKHLNSDRVYPGYEQLAETHSQISGLRGRVFRITGPGSAAEGNSPAAQK